MVNVLEEFVIVKMDGQVKTVKNIHALELVMMNQMYVQAMELA
jgi:hypothetical protein